MVGPVKPPRASPLFPCPPRSPHAASSASRRRRTDTALPPPARGERRCHGEAAPGAVRPWEGRAAGGGARRGHGLPGAPAAALPLAAPHGRGQAEGNGPWRAAGRDGAGRRALGGALQRAVQSGRGLSGEEPRAAATPLASRSNGGGEGRGCCAGCVTVGTAPRDPSRFYEWGRERGFPGLWEGGGSGGRLTRQPLGSPRCALEWMALRSAALNSGSEKKETGGRNAIIII